MQKSPHNMREEDVAKYCDLVKQVFADHPQVYDEFIVTMRKFKSHEITTLDVIDHVRRLFRGYPILIQGFNAFLPDEIDYKVELTDVDVSVVTNNNAAAPTAAMPQAFATVTAAVSNTFPAANQTSAQQQQQTLLGAQQPSCNIQQEADAINYVTKIRNRFSNEPEIYQSFLAILHTFQKEQKGIKEVLEQVAVLFADHTDLLMEFVYFLPNAVQDKARERLERAAKESVARRASLGNGMNVAGGMGGNMAGMIAAGDNAMLNGNLLNNTNSNAGIFTGQHAGHQFFANSSYGQQRMVTKNALQACVFLDLQTIAALTSYDVLRYDMKDCESWDSPYSYNSTMRRLSLLDHALFLSDDNKPNADVLRRQAFSLLQEKGAPPTIYHYLKIGMYNDIISKIDKQELFDVSRLAKTIIPACIFHRACQHGNVPIISSLLVLLWNQFLSSDVQRSYDIVCSLPGTKAEECLSVLLVSFDQSHERYRVQLYHYIRADDQDGLASALADNPVRLFEETAIYGQQLLHYALQYGTLATLRILLNHKAPVDRRGLCTEPLIHRAAKLCSPIMFDVFLEYLQKTHMEWIALEEHFDVPMIEVIRPDLYVLLFKYEILVALLEIEFSVSKLVDISTKLKQHLSDYCQPPMSIVEMMLKLQSHLSEEDMQTLLRVTDQQLLRGVMNLVISAYERPMFPQKQMLKPVEQVSDESNALLRNDQYGRLCILIQFIESTKEGFMLEEFQKQLDLFPELLHLRLNHVELEDTEETWECNLVEYLSHKVTTFVSEFTYQFYEDFCEDFEVKRDRYQKYAEILYKRGGKFAPDILIVLNMIDALNAELTADQSLIGFKTTLPHMMQLSYYNDDDMSESEIEDTSSVEEGDGNVDICETESIPPNADSDAGVSGAVSSPTEAQTSSPQGVSLIYLACLIAGEEAVKVLLQHGVRWVDVHVDSVVGEMLEFNETFQRKYTEHSLTHPTNELKLYSCASSVVVKMIEFDIVSALHEALELVPDLPFCVFKFNDNNSNSNSKDLLVYSLFDLALKFGSVRTAILLHERGLSQFEFTYTLMEQKNWSETEAVEYTNIKSRKIRLLKSDNPQGIKEIMQRIPREAILCHGEVFYLDVLKSLENTYSWRDSEGCSIAIIPNKKQNENIDDNDDNDSGNISLERDYNNEEILFIVRNDLADELTIVLETGRHKQTLENCVFEFYTCANNADDDNDNTIHLEEKLRVHATSILREACLYGSLDCVQLMLSLEFDIRKECTLRLKGDWRGRGRSKWSTLCLVSVTDCPMTLKGKEIAQLLHRSGLPIPSVLPNADFTKSIVKLAYFELLTSDHLQSILASSFPSASAVPNGRFLQDLTVALQSLGGDISDQLAQVCVEFARDLPAATDIDCCEGDGLEKPTSADALSEKTFYDLLSLCKESFDPLLALFDASGRDRLAALLSDGKLQNLDYEYTFPYVFQYSSLEASAAQMVHPSYQSICELLLNPQGPVPNLCCYEDYLCMLAFFDCPTVLDDALEEYFAANSVQNPEKCLSRYLHKFIPAKQLVRHDMRSVVLILLRYLSDCSTRSGTTYQLLAFACILGQPEFIRLLQEFEIVNYRKTCRKHVPDNDMLELCWRYDQRGVTLSNKARFVHTETAVMLSETAPVEWDLLIYNCSNCGAGIKDTFLLKLICSSVSRDVKNYIIENSVYADDPASAIYYLNEQKCFDEDEIKSMKPSLAEEMRQLLSDRARRHFRSFLVYHSHINNSSAGARRPAYDYVFSDWSLCEEIASYLGPDLFVNKELLWTGVLFGRIYEEEEEEMEEEDEDKDHEDTNMN